MELFCVIVVFYMTLLHSIFAVHELKAEIYTTKSFDLIHSTSYPHFIMFYAPWCNHCEKLLPLWDSFAKENHENRRMKVAKIDCVENTPLCASEDIKAYPTLRLFSNHEKYTYRGYRNVDGFNNFVKDKVKNIKDGQVPIYSPKTVYEPAKKTATIHGKQDKSMIVTNEIFLKLSKDGYAFIDFYAPWCPHCIKLEPVWDQLAARYKHDDKMVIGKVDCTAEPDLCKEQMIRAYPTLNLYKNGVMINQYNGPRSLSEITDFIESNVDRITTTDSATVDQPSFSPELLYVVDREFEYLVTKYNLLVYFHHPRDEKAYDHMGTMNNLEEFYTTAKHFEENPSFNIRAVIVNCQQDLDFCKRVTVTGFPSIYLFHTMETQIFYEGRILKESLVKFAVNFASDKKRDEL